MRTNCNWKCNWLDENWYFSIKNLSNKKYQILNLKWSIFNPKITQKWHFLGFFDDNNYFNSFYFRRFSSKCDFHQFNRRLPLGSTAVTKTSWWTLFKIFLQRIIRKFPTYLVIYPILWNGQVSKCWWDLSSYGSTDFYLTGHRKSTGSEQKADRKWTGTVCGSIKGFNSSVQDQSVLKYCHPFFKQLDVLEKNAVPGTGKGNYSRNLESTFMRKDDYIRARGHPPNDYILLSVSKLQIFHVKMLRY